MRWSAPCRLATPFTAKIDSGLIWGYCHLELLRSLQHFLEKGCKPLTVLARCRPHGTLGPPLHFIISDDFSLCRSNDFSAPESRHSLQKSIHVERSGHRIPHSALRCGTISWTKRRNEAPP